jgi:hypothetical protein
MKVLSGDDIDVVSLWTWWAPVAPVWRVAAILLWMHNGLGYIYGQVSG